MISVTCNHLSHFLVCWFTGVTRWVVCVRSGRPAGVSRSYLTHVSWLRRSRLYHNNNTLLTAHIYTVHQKQQPLQSTA